MTRDERPVSGAVKALSILLALIAPARMAWIVFTYGENNLSNDYVMRVPLVASLLDGTCTPGSYFRNAWIGGGHSALALTPVYWLSARFFAWDVRFELALGLLIAGATLALIAATLPPRTRWFVLPPLSLLLFSTAKVSSFTFGESTIQMGLAQLGVALGVFAFARRGGRPLALAAWAAAGGVLASWSWGGGIMAWPALFAAFALRRERRLAPWAILGAGAALGLAQYVWILPGEMAHAGAAPADWASKGRLFLDVLGRPLVNGIGHADPDALSQALGAAGLVALAGLLYAGRAELRARPAAPVLIAWTLLVALEIVAFRSAVAPWYASPLTLFWAGLVLLAAAAPAPARAAAIFTVAALALRVQGGWEDKSFYLPSRAPASAACLREWRTAPPACHDRVFQWGESGRPNELALLGEPLERRGLSVFGPHRTYLAQGDLAVGRVASTNPKAAAFFSRDGRTPGDPDDFHRLDLVLAPDAAVTWRVDLPPNLKSARFETRVRASANDPMLARGARVEVAGEPGGARALVPAGGDEPLALDLGPFAGRTVTLRLTAEGAEAGAPMVFEPPKIEISLRRGAERKGAS